MNPNTPFSGQPSGGFQASPGVSTGMFSSQPPFQFNQLSLFGLNSGGVKNPGFTDFTITSGLRNSSGQGLGFGQLPGFTQSYSLGQTTTFVTSAPMTASVPSKSGFSFRPPTNLGNSQSTSAFATGLGEASGGSFVRSDFSFKSPENAVFKPIFGTNLEQEKIPTSAVSSSFTFSFPSGAGPGKLTPFVISQESSNSSNTGFSFSKPVSSSSTSAVSFSTSLPSKTLADDKKRPMALFTSPGSSFSSFSTSSLPLRDTFQINKTNKMEHDDLFIPSEPLPILGKGMKRKEEEHSPRHHDYDTDELEPPSRNDHGSNKRPVRLNRPPTQGLFGRVLQDVLKSNKKESKIERVPIESGEMVATSVAVGSQSGFAMAKPISTLRKEEKGKLKHGG